MLRPAARPFEPRASIRPRASHASHDKAHADDARAPGLAPRSPRSFSVSPAAPPPRLTLLDAGQLGASPASPCSPCSPLDLGRADIAAPPASPGALSGKSETAQTAQTALALADSPFAILPEADIRALFTVASAPRTAPTSHAAAFAVREIPPRPRQPTAKRQSKPPDPVGTEHRRAAPRPSTISTGVKASHASWLASPRLVALPSGDLIDLTDLIDLADLIDLTDLIELDDDCALQPSPSSFPSSSSSSTWSLATSWTPDASLDPFSPIASAYTPPTPSPPRSLTPYRDAPSPEPSMAHPTLAALANGSPSRASSRGSRGSRGTRGSPSPHGSRPSSRPATSSPHPTSSPASRPASRGPPHPDHVGPSVHSASAYRFYASLRSPRLDVPQHIREPPVPDALQTTVVDAWARTEPTRARKDEVARLVRDVQDVLDKAYPSGGRFTVDVFGSVSWGGDTGSSGDVDLVILDSKLRRGYEPRLWRAPPDEPSPVAPPGPPSRLKGVPPLYDVYWVRDRLRDAGFAGAQAIAFAATPIVQFQDRTGTLKCDVNTNDLGGWYNSSLILHYCLIAPHVLRPMIFALKRWLSAHELNDSSGARGPPSMSSYCVTLMAIAYLQVRGVLPNLQADVAAAVPSYADTEEPDAVWVGWAKPQATKARVGFARWPPAGWASREPGLTAADALRGFFAYFARGGGFDYDTMLVSVLHGGVLPRASAKHDETKAEHVQRERMKAAGYSMDAIAAEMGRLLAERRGQEVHMGKGDLGIQPKNWAEKRLIVQDPFLWEKNCAGGMSKDGLDRFLAAVDHADLVLRARGPDATLDSILGPSAYSTPKRKPAGGGRARRGAKPVTGLALGVYASENGRVPPLLQ